MVASSTIGISQTTQQYLTTKKVPQPHSKYIYSDGNVRVLNQIWVENWDDSEYVGLENLASKAQNNVKLQNMAYVFMGLGVGLTVNNLVVPGSILIGVGSIQLLCVNGRNTKLIFSLTHPQNTKL